MLGSVADDLRKNLKEKPPCAATFPPSRLWAFAAPFQVLYSRPLEPAFGVVGPGKEGQPRRSTSLLDFLPSPSRFPT